ncbi:hypothetical protein [Pseudomonas mohnii]
MTYVREQTSEELAAHMRSLQRMAGWFEPLADRLWQEVEALQATIANQAQMIEHLRGGATPGFTAVDMGTAAADGRRSLAEHLIKQIAIEHPDQDTLLTVKHIAQWIALETGL